MRIIIISIFLLFSAETFAQELPPKLLSIITNDFSDFRIADRSDFSPLFHVLKSEGFDVDKYINTIVSANFNSDSKNDYILLLKNENERKFLFVAFISSTTGYTYYKLTGQSWPIQHDGSIWETMWLKSSGEPGMSDEKYFNGPDGATYPYLSKHTQNDIDRYQKAISKYVSLNVLEKTKLTYLSHMATDDLFYCKEAFFFENGEFKNLHKCD